MVFQRSLFLSLGAIAIRTQWLAMNIKFYVYCLKFLTNDHIYTQQMAYTAKQEYSARASINKHGTTNVWPW